MSQFNKTLGKFQLVDIPPAPRGVPQIEVTFDIDANGIVHVSAKDRATGKEQSITITGQSSLDQDKIDQMIADAEAHANEDRERKEEAETRNTADSMIYQTEKMINDNADKLGEEEKTDIEEKIATLKTSLEGDAMDLESVKNAMEELTIASQGFAQRLYETASQEAEAQEDESEDIIDAEIIDEDE